MRVAIVGLGLIGGSMALDLKKSGYAETVIGVDTNPAHAQQAMELNIVEEVLPLESAVAASEFIILAVPVGQLVNLLPVVLDLIKDQILIDVGSTKSMLVELAKAHPKGKNYVATHPMAGTEFSGPTAAIEGLFKDKVAIICDQYHSRPEYVAKVIEMYDHLNMGVVHMPADEHDVHAAYVSHISHISSFALALTVLEKEKKSQNILVMASGGFDSTVRLAKSSHKMWTPVFQQNSDNLINVLQTYIDELNKFKDAIEQGDAEKLDDLILTANQIKKILK
jgi:prephenate dehydrogenase